MVTAKTQYSLKNGTGYFEEHLCVGDNYDEGQRVSGERIGLGAERLVVSGKVRAEGFLGLCDKLNQETDPPNQDHEAQRISDRSRRANLLRLLVISVRLGQI